MTHRSRRWGNCHWARSSRDAARPRRDGSVAGVECTSGFRQTWEWLGERLRECAWFTKFDGLPTATSVVLNEIFGRQRLHGLYGAERRLFDGRANS